jgi:transcriptional regulator with XRE-family HTH domain
MEIKAKFGKIIKQLRSNKGFSQEELGHRAGLHRTYIGMIERAEKNITIENICKLSKALDVPLSSIFLEIEKDG